jgi:NADH-quinone oxidoreductase subunit M
MFKRIFFGKIPEELVHVKDSNRYITATMGVFAAMTLVIGVYPDLFLAPISDYIGGMFEGQEDVLPIPVHAEGGESTLFSNPPNDIAVEEEGGSG